MIRRLALAVVGLAAGFLAVSALREATLSTHQDLPADSSTVVVLETEARGAERSQSVAEMTEALVLTCRLEVNSDLVGPIIQLDDERFRIALAPALDQTDRRQFKGCVEDWTVDHLLVDVLRMEQRSVS